MATKAKPKAKAKAKPAAPAKAKPKPKVAAKPKAKAAPERDDAALREPERRVRELEGELEQLRGERLTALERMTELEERLGSSAEAHGGDAAPVEVPDVHELERQLSDLTEELEGEREAHARTRARLEANEATTAHDGSEHDRRLHDQITQLQNELEQREQEIRELQRPADLLTCPRCRGEMVEFVHLGVTLDRCNDCAGLFFDAGELQEVIKREYPDPEPQLPIEVAPEMVVPDEAPKRKGFFRSLFSRKDAPST
jgi:Transcription factor zinc-finger